MIPFQGSTLWSSARRDERERLGRLNPFGADDGSRHGRTSPQLHAQANLCMQFRHIACTYSSFVC